MPSPLDEIRDAADALTNPRVNNEPRYEWDHNRHRKPIEPHKTTVPGLVQQLRNLAAPGVDGDAGGRGGPESCPVAIDAVSLLAAIEFGAAYRCEQHGISRRDSAEAHIRALVGVAPRLDHDRQSTIRRELRSWLWQAEIVTGWRTPPRELLAPCPECDARGTLLATPDPDDPSARCVGCGTKWDAASIGVLGRHVIDYQTRVGVTQAELRAAAVSERRRAEGSTAA